MNARAGKWMKRGLWTLGGLAAISVLVLGYLWVGGVLLDRGQEVEDPDIAAYVPVREPSPGAQALLDMGRRVEQGECLGCPICGRCRDLTLLRHYANTVDRDEIDERGFVLDRFDSDDAFRRAWIAQVLASNQFVFAALDRADADADFRFADASNSNVQTTWPKLPYWGCVSAFRGPVLAQVRFDAESGDTAAMTAHFARALRVLGRLKGSGGLGGPLVSTVCQVDMVDGMSGLVDEYDFSVEDLLRLDQILASTPVVQDEDWRRALVREYVRFRMHVETRLCGGRFLYPYHRQRCDVGPDWLQRLCQGYAYQPRNMLGLMARQIADAKAKGFDLKNLRRRRWDRRKTASARSGQWWRPGFLMHEACYLVWYWHCDRFLECCDGRDRVQALRKKIADRIELKRRGGTPVLKKHVFGRPADEENQSE